MYILSVHGEANSHAQRKSGPRGVVRDGIYWIEASDTENV